MKALVLFFRNSLPFTFAVILAICVSFWVIEFFTFGQTSTPAVFNQHSLLFPSVANVFGGAPLLMWLAGAIFFIVFALLVLNLNSKYIFIQERTFMPVLFLGLLVGFPDSGLVLTPVALFSLLFVFALNRIFSSYRKDQALSNFFEASFFIGVGSFFWLPGIIFILVVFAGLAVFRQFNWREWVVSVFGFLAPFVFFELYQLFFNDRSWVLADAILLAFRTTGPYVGTLSKFNLIFIVYVGFLVFLGSLKILQHYNSFKIHSRKIFIVFFWTFICALFGFWFLRGITYEIIFIGAAPASFLLTYFFSVDNKPSRFQALLFVLFIVMAFLQLFLN